MVQNQLRFHLDHVAKRVSSIRLWSLLLLFGLGLVVTGFAADSLVGPSGELRQRVVYGLGAAAIVCGLAAWIRSRVGAANYSQLAKRVEDRFPELDSRLLTAVQIDVSRNKGTTGYLEQAVIHQALVHGSRNPWDASVSTRLIWMYRSLGLAAWVGFLATLALLWSPPEVNQQAVGSDLLEAPQLSKLSLIGISPGNTELERGSSLIVTAEYGGTLPKSATLVVTNQLGDERRIEMSGNSFDDPVFAARVSAVDVPIYYYVEMDNIVSDTYFVDVFEYPRLRRADVLLEYPEYSGMQPRLVEDTRRVSAVVGTQLLITCYLNKQVEQLWMVEETNSEDDSKSREPIEFKLVSRAESRYEAELLLERDLKFRLYMRDEQSRENRNPPRFQFTALANRPPKVKIETPARDVSVSALEELDLIASFSDDYGLKGYGLVYSFGGQQFEVDLDARDSESEENLAKQAEAKHQLYFEELGARQNDLLTYYFWASDFDAAGNERRAYSDMFFADVRPFDEIFRQGEQPPGGAQQQQQQQQQQGGPQGGGQAAELVDLQKQIINGTWNLIRRETGAEVSASFDSDVDTLRESQLSAVEQAKEMLSEVADPELAELGGPLLLEMQRAAERLGRALLDDDVSALNEALPAEQAALCVLD